ncbi:hypothetical protein EWM64_g1670, partial [Hericium alpestre]
DVYKQKIAEAVFWLRSKNGIPLDEDLEQDPSMQTKFISNNIVLFCSIPALQEQNQDMLKMVWKTGEKTVHEEQGKKISSGSFGDIYLGINIICGEEVAIKRESLKAKHPQLEYESKGLQDPH